MGTRTPEVETTREGASAARYGAKKVGLIAATGSTRGLSGTGCDLLLLDLEDRRQARRSRPSTIVSAHVRAVLAVRLRSHRGRVIIKQGGVGRKVGVGVRVGVVTPSAGLSRRCGRGYRSGLLRGGRRRG